MWDRKVVSCPLIVICACRHVEVKTGPAHRYVFSLKNHPEVKQGEIAFSMVQVRSSSDETEHGKIRFLKCADKAPIHGPP